MKSVKKEIGGRPFAIETGRMARQADGAVVVRYGETEVLVTVVAGESKEDGSDFFPLTVDYREKTFAAGKIPGGFFKREGRPTNKEILTMRLADRSLRPLFPSNYGGEVQIISLVLSADSENDPDILSITGSSAAIQLAGLPAHSPIAAVRVGLIQNEFIINPSHQQLAKSSLNLVLAGTQDAIVMVEAGALEVSEKVMVEALAFGHAYIKQIIAMQQELIAGMEIPAVKFMKDTQPQQEFLEKIQPFSERIAESLQTKKKKDRHKNLDALLEEIVKSLFPEGAPSVIERALVQKVYEQKQREIVRKWIQEGKRIDGRNLKEIRPITCEVSVLPRPHGSALFTRGETQALVTATLGTSGDEQVVEGLLAESSKRFMLHYDFPPFCVGEVRQIRSPQRREIGHGALAERALEPVVPEEARFPYTIRIVSEILESNGSSSMATICGGTLAMMDAGIPIKRPVAGIAMGLLMEGEKAYVLTDIMGSEDHYGDMDFKVAGTQLGITALQMDIKVKGINQEILGQALDQAKEARIEILRKMIGVLDFPRDEVSIYAPKVIQMKVPPEKIHIVIGSGGKTIRSIQEQTNSKIDIDDTGAITLYCKDRDGATAARQAIEQLTAEAEIGKIYKGKVTSVKDFGAFVEIMPGVEGLVHVSELAKTFVANVSDVVKFGDEIMVKVIFIDEQNRIKLSKKAAESNETEASTPAPTPTPTPEKQEAPRPQGQNYQNGNHDPRPQNPRNYRKSPGGRDQGGRDQGGRDQGGRRGRPRR